MKRSHIILISIATLGIAIVGAVTLLSDLVIQGESDQSLDEIQFEFEQPEASATINHPNKNDPVTNDQDQAHNSTADAGDESVRSSEPSSNRPVDETPAPEPFQTGGRLKLVADGKVFGEEEYRLTRTSSGSYQLISTGYFQFKVVLINTKFHFQQAIGWNEETTPEILSFKINGPLGVGNREFDIDFSPEEPYRTASIVTAESQEDVRLPRGELVVQGTFSSFAMLPYIMGDRDEAEIQLIIANGFGPRNTAGATSNEIELIHLGQVVVRDKNQEILVDEYQFAPSDSGSEAENGSLRLLYTANEMIGIYAKSTDERAESFQVYRSDLFPEGFEIVSQH